MKMRTKIITALIVLVGFTTLAFVNKSKEVSSNDLITEKVLAKPQIDQRTGKVYFDFEGEEKELMYGIRGLDMRPIELKKLKEAKSLKDLISGYPTNWITSYVSVELTTTTNGKTVKAVGKNDILTDEQRKNLNASKMGTSVVIDVKYKYDNPATKKTENNNIHVAMGVIPKTQAEYIGGHQEMGIYLRENGFNKVPKDIESAVVIFTVNKDGQVSNARMNTTSGDVETDELLIKLVNGMPKWKPAENFEGTKVKQDLQFVVGEMVGC